MIRFCMLVAGCGLTFSALLYAAQRQQWKIAGPMMRHLPRIATVTAAVLLLIFVLIVSAGASNVGDALVKGLKDAEYALRNWFSGLKFRTG